MAKELDANTDGFIDTDLLGLFSNYKEVIYNVAATGSTETIDLANGNVQRFAMDQACEFTLPTLPATAGQTASFTQIIEPTAFAMTWAASPPVKWMTSDKLGPATVAANLVVVVTFVADTYEGTPRWLGFVGGREVA